MLDDGHSVNQHHFLPKSRGGKEQVYCHDFLHRNWTNKELETNYLDPEIIRKDEKIQKFLNWIKNKDPLFYEKTKDSNSRKGKSRR
jgi:hypothetical protein